MTIDVTEDEKERIIKQFKKFVKVPSVIDREMIMNSVLTSAPTEVCKKLFKRNKFEYEYVFKLYLDFKDILKIDHLWMMKNLKILSLAHNYIETIENLEELVNLVQLDLSFNRITQIDGLQGLKNIEVLCLYNNQIKKIEKLDDLDKLSIFSIGNNEIAESDCVYYLRRFKKLLSINMANNPCTQTKYFKESLAAYVPSLLYYDYKLITQQERDVGLEYNAEALKMLEIEELKKLKEEEQLKLKQDKDEFLANAFIEGLGINQLYTKMFFKDFEGNAFRELGEHTYETYERLRLSVNEISLDICKVGEENYTRRQKEVNIFKKSWEENQKVSEQKAFHQQVQLIQKWKHLVLEIAKYLKANSHALRTSDEEGTHKILAEYRSLMNRAEEEFEGEWYKLMEVEMKTYDKNEAVISLYESVLSEIINIFIEKSQSYFTLMRDSETDFIEDMTVKLNKYMVEVYQRSEIQNIPLVLRNIVCDKDSLSNAIIACHDRHTLAIDTKEDYIISKLKEWHTNETGHLQRLEILRNRKAVLKIRYSADKANRLFKKKASVMLNYFKTPEQLFVKSKKIKSRVEGEEYGTSTEDEETTTVISEESSDEQDLKEITSETEFNENIDWTKLFNKIIEEIESVLPKYVKKKPVHSLSFSSLEEESDEQPAECLKKKSVVTVTDMGDDLQSEETEI